MNAEQMKILETLATAFAPLAKASGTPAVPPDLYANGGLFGACSHDPVLINAVVGPFGYMGRLAWRGEIYENPIVEALTYVGSTGYSQSGDCADCGKPVVKRCAQTVCFGRICQQTEEMAFDSIGLRANAGVPTLAFYGNITGPSGEVIIPQGQPITDAFTLQVAAAAYNLRRRIGQLIWTGDPANNAGGYAEFPGFDLLINTGKADAYTGTACPALDSLIYNYGGAVVGASGSPSIVQVVSAMVRRLRYRMMTAGFDADAAVMDIVISPTLADCLFNAWACEYGLTCQSTSTTMTNDALAIAELRDTFRNGGFVRIDGRNYPVVLDNGIAVTNAPYGNDTKRCSTIYVITREVPGAPNGGIVTWGEYQDMQRTAGDVVAWFRQMFGSSSVALTDGGRFAVAPTTYGGYCFDVRVLTKPRIRMLMPWTSGRITNVCCVETIKTPDVTGSGGIYELDGGVYESPELTLYGDCWPE